MGKIRKIHFLIIILIADLVLLVLVVWELMHAQSLTDKQIAGDKRVLVGSVLNAIAFLVLIYNEKKTE